MESQTEFIRQIMRHEPSQQIEAITTGWDNDLYVVNGSLAFRFPKTEEVAKKVQKEMALLNELKEQMQTVLAVPDYKPHYGSDGTLRCVSYEFLPGTSFQGRQSEQTAENAQLLGTFLSQLHRIRPTSKFETSRNKEYWVRFYEELQEKVVPQMEKSDQKAVKSVFESFLDDFKEEHNATLIHGDLTLSNIIGQQGKAAGIIDFTDAHIGDASLDFAGFYWEYGPDFTKKVLGFYSGEKREELFERIAQFYGIQPVFHELLYKVENGIPVNWRQTLHKFHVLRK